MSLQLSTTQKKIVDAPDGHYLVVASAGSGKTRVLTERVRHLLEVRRIRSRILALTFTNRAAEEMRHRLQNVPDLADRAYIGTIHGFCQGVIEAHGRHIGFDQPPTIIERESDRIAMLEEVFNETAELRRFLLQYDTPQNRRKFLYEVLQTFSRCKRDWDDFEAITSGNWGNETEAHAFRQYQEHLGSQRVIDFDDILIFTYRVLTERPAVAEIYRRTYQYLCVDEAQDLNSVQYALIRTLGQGARSILLVGDPNQAIYGFNGSSKRFMLDEFTADFAVEQIRMCENYRSSRAVIRAANGLYADSIDLEDAALEGELQIVPCPNEQAEAQWVGDKIRALLAAATHPEIDGPITLASMAVLARNRYVFGPLQEFLIAADISHHLRQPGGGTSLESDLGRILDLGIRLLVNPMNRLHWGEAARLLGASLDFSVAPSDPLDGLKNMAAMASEPWRSRMVPLLNAWRLFQEDVNKFGTAIDSLASTTVDQGLQIEEQALALADLDFLRTVWSNYTQRTARDHRSLGQFRNQMATGETVPHVQGRGLTLATVHAVKGLEFDIVFLMGLVEGGFPDYRAVKAGGSVLAEEKNDAFVALTRAKRFLYLTWPQTKFMPWDRDNRVNQRKSRFVAEIEAKLALPSTMTAKVRVAEDAGHYPQNF